MDAQTILGEHRSLLQFYLLSYSTFKQIKNMNYFTITKNFLYQVKKSIRLGKFDYQNLKNKTQKLKRAKHEVKDTHDLLGCVQLVKFVQRREESFDLFFQVNGAR